MRIKETKTKFLSDCVGRWQVEDGGKVLTELINTPNMTAIHLELDADMESIPSVTYTITRYVLPERKDEQTIRG